MYWDIVAKVSPTYPLTPCSSAATSLCLRPKRFLAS